MKHALAAAAALAVLVPSHLRADAREVAGVNVDEAVNVAGKDLKLNGAGIRKATVLKVKVYVGALYVETPSKDGAAILANDQIMRVKEIFVRSVGKDKLVDTYKDDFKDHAGAALSKYQDRIDKFLAVVNDVKEGDVVELTYVPGKGTTVALQGADKVTVEGKDFAQLLFGFWLGPNPVDHGLQDGMLGK